MSHTQEILDLVGEWQRKRFRENEITLADAVASLDSDEPLVVVAPGSSNSRWILYTKDTNKVAVLVHAGIWQWKCDLETGNYVPEGFEAPEGLPENRIQDTPSFKCELSYAFDTSLDTTIWDHIQALEDHVSAQPGFNKAKRNRKSWQNGKVASARQKYVVSAKLFTKRTPYNTKDGEDFSAPYELHPWIMYAMDNQADTLQVPNPDRPKYYDVTDGILRKLEDTNNPTFQPNDIIWMSCKIGFSVTGDGWTSEIIPIELIRVGKLPEHLTSKSDPAMFPPHDETLPSLEPGGPVAVIDGPSRPLKRPSEEISDRILGSSKRQAMETDFDMVEQEDDIPREVATRNGGNYKNRGKGNKENRR